MSGTHSLFSPSGAHRWSRCVGSLAMSRGIPNVTTKYSAEGTAYHTIAARALSTGLDCDTWVGDKLTVDGFEFVIDDNNAAAAQVYVDTIRQMPGELYVEVALDSTPVLGIADQGGTGDAVLLDYDARTIRAHDLKFGMGEIVFAKDNEQLLIYGADAMLQFDLLGDWQHLEVGIHQPRVNHLDIHVYTRAEVEAFVHHIRERAQLAKEIYEGPVLDLKFLTPGEKQCRWCPARGECPARTQKMLDMFPVTKQNKPSFKLTDEEIAEARNRVDEIEAWCSDIKQQAFQRAMNGATIPGWKLIAGRKGNRKFVDETLAETQMKVLGEAAYAPREIITPSVADTKMKKKFAEQWAQMQDNITQSPGSQTLTREFDPRGADQAAPRVEFGLVQEFV